MNYRHGHAARSKAGTQSKAYRAWSGMKRRCYNPNAKAFKDYGGRGIAVCERWHDFVNFFEDMGEPPAGMTLDRIDNNGNYEPGNCRWATMKEQSQNRRGRHMVTAQGVERSLADWSEITGISISTLFARIAVYGWSGERAVTEPLVPHRKRNFGQATITHNGETLSYSEWAEKVGVSYRTILRRVKNGLSVEDVLSKSNPATTRAERVDIPEWVR